MILTTGGHENSIGPEIYIKSILLLPISQQKNYLLFCSKKAIEKTLKTLGLGHEIHRDYILISRSRIHCEFIRPKKNSETLASILQALEYLNPKKDILLTLPSSKDQFSYSGTSYNGHTEFLRHFYKSQHLSMGFYFNKTLFNLITDHIPLKDVATSISKELILEKTKNVIAGANQYFHGIDEVYFSGINPHAGENGRLGNEEKLIHAALDELTSLYPKINFYGPYSGDIIIKNKNILKNQIFTFFHHDQGLGIFKSMYQFYGLNITFGLPFLRMSVDHGTAFNLFGKNCANYLGCHYMLTIAHELQKKC